MSTLAEIEAAIEHLPPLQVDELVSWLAQRKTQPVAQLSVEAWLVKARGAAKPGVTTDGVLALTRSEV